MLQIKKLMITSNIGRNGRLESLILSGTLLFIKLFIKKSVIKGKHVAL